MRIRFGWIIGVVTFFAIAPAQAAPRRDLAPAPDLVPRWEAAGTPNVALGPACRRAEAAPEDTFELQMRRGVQLKYASPITVSGWRSPQSACRRFNASGRFNVKRFRFRSAKQIRASLARFEFETTFSYGWKYHRRYTLQRIEPGLILFGTLENMPHATLFCDFDIANVWQLRLENTVDLAMRDSMDVRASMKYTF